MHEIDFLVQGHFFEHQVGTLVEPRGWCSSKDAVQGDSGPAAFAVMTLTTVHRPSAAAKAALRQVTILCSFKLPPSVLQL